MFKFKILKSTILPQVKFIEYSSYKDNRGFIFSIYDKEIEKKLIKFTKKKFTHDKIVFRKKNILTGIHGDKKTWKLISCLRGKIYQVVVNCNEKSKNFGKYFSCFLNGKDCKSILIPPNYGNAYLTLNKENIYYYKLAYKGRYFDHDEQFTYLWNNEKFNIKWPINNPILSSRDSKEV